MRTTTDVLIIGAGHNGLVAAAYLAKAGYSVTVLERRDIVGGAAVSEAVWPGWRVSTASYVCSLLHPRIIEELELARFGYAAYVKDPSSFTPLLDGRSLLLGKNDADNDREIAKFSADDVRGFHACEAKAAELGAVLADLFDKPDETLMKLGNADTALLAGSAAEFVAHYIETPVLQATLATDGLIGTYAGPYEPGTMMVLAHHYAGRALGTQGTWGYVRGGMGSITQALADSARSHGARITTGVTVSKILLREGAAYGVVTAEGRDYTARMVLANTDPVTTFTNFIPEASRPPAITAQLAGWRSEGVSLKLNLALGELPNFTARPGMQPLPHHRATIHVAPSLPYLQDGVDDARRLGSPRAPMLECFLQTTTDDSIAPAGKHLLSIFAQWYPYTRADGPWDQAKRDAAVRDIVATLAQYAPNLPSSIEAHQVLAPPDLEARFGLHHGHIFHGELLFDQALGRRFATRTPIPGLYLCGSGSAPGGCVSGIPGLRAAQIAIEDLAD